MYVLKNIAKEFIKEFHKRPTQKYNKATALVKRLKKEYVIHKVHTLAK